MSALGRRLGRLALIFCLLAAAVAALAGGVRLLPWLLAPDVPLRVCVPFAKALGARALEAALLLGLPLAAAVAASDFVRRGEFRALESLGLSPHGATLSLAPGIAAVGFLAALINLELGAEASRPGQFARDLIGQARASCEDDAEPRAVTVPVVGVVWLCFPDAAPRVVGPVPRSSGRIWFSAAGLEAVDDLTALVARDVVVGLRPASGRPRVEVRVKRATLRGLPGWGVAPGGGWRSWWLGFSLWVTTLGITWQVLRFRTERRFLALMLGGVPALVLLRLLHADRVGVFVLAPGAALAVAWLIVVASGIRSWFHGRLARFGRLGSRV